MRILKGVIQQKQSTSDTEKEQEPEKQEGHIRIDDIEYEVPELQPPEKTRKTRREKSSDEGYNSEDEHTIRLRPRVTKTIDDAQLQFVDPAHLARCLTRKNLQIIPMAKDGNCLFRSIADQLYGDADGHHEEVRRKCVDYMERERDHFSQFVTEDFSSYLARKRQNATYGNHLELQALSELYHRQILIYTTDENPINVFQDDYRTEYPPFQISYHYGNHYNSVRNPNDPGFLTGTGLPGTEPGAAERDLMKTAEYDSVTDMIVSAEQNLTDTELLDSAVLEQVKKESERESERTIPQGWNDTDDYDAEMQMALQLSMQTQ